MMMEERSPETSGDMRHSVRGTMIRKKKEKKPVEMVIQFLKGFFPPVRQKVSTQIKGGKDQQEPHNVVCPDGGSDNTIHQ